MADGTFFVSEQIKARGNGPSRSRYLCLPEDASIRRQDAENRLIRDNPSASCTLGVTQAQKQFARQIFALTGLGLLVAPGCGVLALSWSLFALFALLILHRGIVLWSGIASKYLKDDVGHSGSGTKAIWPVYTVLVPVYREPKAVEGLVAALKGLDYPRRQLDIQILIEEADKETLDALLALKLKPQFRIVPVPKGSVQTKPRALNYGLSLARGQYVAIYDAEDQMHAGQLKAAVRAFQASDGKRLACVQAPLIPHNGAESWVARQFELEYLIHFGLIVPGLAGLDVPVMLGGTSNHFRRDVLEKVGGWDPYNVTEDADLGLRLSAAGYRIGVISPPTYEEAPVARRQWIGQRSRWVKGFMQTLGVFTRHPEHMIAEMGMLRWNSAMLLLGGSVFSALMHGPLALWLLACGLLPGLTPPAEAVWLLATGFSLHLLASLCSWKRISPAYVFGALTAPFYWPMQTLAAIKAIRELMKNPYFWDKTEHGLTAKTLCRSRLRTKL